MIEPAVQQRLQPQLYRLVGFVCADCDFAGISSRKTCPSCGHGSLETKQFSPDGTLISFTAVTRPLPPFASQATATVGLIRLNDGPTVLAQIVDGSTLHLEIGIQGKLVTRRLFETSQSGLICYGYKFEPSLNSRNNDA